MIEFKDPPGNVSGAHSSHAWGDVAAALRARPGQWALVAEGVNAGTAGFINRGTGVAFRPAGSFEAITRNNKVIDGKRRGDIYARYVGEAQS